MTLEAMVVAVRPHTTQLLPRALYALTGLPLGVASLVLFTTGLSLSFGLLVVGVGFVILSLVLRLASGMARVERFVVRELVGVHIDPPTRAVTDGAARTIIGPLRDPSRWRELVFLVLRFPLGLASFVLAVLTVAYPLWAASTLIWAWGIFGWWVPLIVVTGLISVAAGPLLLFGITEAQIQLAHSLLGPSTTELTERSTHVRVSRDRSVEAAEAERRRIERDLHDGAQARLATVALDLGRARRRLEQGAPAAEVSEIIDGAHGDAKAAIVELRDLARGIHPAVLADRGLEAALSDATSRCSVPVHLDVNVARRPAAHIESAAYFAVCELLNNVGRHSRASNCWAIVRSDDASVAIEVSDDGVGGLDANLGTGISGLRNRIDSVDGTFDVRSPLGEGTVVSIDIPHPTPRPRPQS
ncbi:MAG: sensor histidine kinase [Acidimicrobiales bacterium]